MSDNRYDPSARRVSQRHKAQPMAPSNVVYQHSQQAPNYYDRGMSDSRDSLIYEDEQSMMQQRRFQPVNQSVQPGYDSMTPASNIPDEITTRSRQGAPKYYDNQQKRDPNYPGAPYYVDPNMAAQPKQQYKMVPAQAPLVPVLQQPVAYAPVNAGSQYPPGGQVPMQYVKQAVTPQPVLKQYPGNLVPSSRSSRVMHPGEESGLDYFEDDREVDEGTAVAPQRRPVVKSHGPGAQRPAPRRGTSPKKPMYDFGTDLSDNEDYVKSPPRMSRQQTDPAPYRNDSPSRMPVRKSGGPSQTQSASRMPRSDSIEEDSQKWHKIQDQIEQEYQRKLQEVNDEAFRKMKTYEVEREELMQKAEYLKKQQRADSRASRARMEQNASRNNLHSRADSRLSGFSNLSFLSQTKGVSRAPDRNRFFSPRTVDLPPLELEEQDTETIKIKKFYKEYCQVVKKNLTPEKQIYLVDILEQLHFLDDEAVNDTRETLCQLLRSHRDQLMIQSYSGEYSGEKEDIVKNLFKFCCGIQNFKLKQRGHNQMNDELIRQIIDAVSHEHEDPNFIIMDQIYTIHNIISRTAYFLTHSQMGYIHKKFRNLFKQRKEWLEAEERTRMVQMSKPVIQRPVPQGQKEPIKYINPRDAQLEHEKPRVVKSQQRMPIHQSQQVKTNTLPMQQFPQTSQFAPYEEADSEQVYTYKPISRQVKQQPKQPNVLYQEQAPRSLSRRSGSKAKGKRPWSGARPQSRSREETFTLGSGRTLLSPQQGKSTSRVQPKKADEFGQYYPQDPRQQVPPQNRMPQRKSVRGPRVQPKHSRSSSNPADYMDPVDTNGSMGQSGPQQSNYLPNTKANQPRRQSQVYSDEEEPICVLKIERDSSNIDEILVYENDEPEDIVEEYGLKFKLTENAKKRLLKNVNEQIAAFYAQNPRIGDTEGSRY